MRSLAAISNELCQNAAGRLGVDERDLEPEQPPAGRFVDQEHVVGLQAGELGGDVVDLKGHVVHARPPLGDEATDGQSCEERDGGGAKAS